MNALPIGDVILLPSGKLLIRAKVGREIKLTALATCQRQADGAFVLEALPERLEMRQAVKILGVPYTTLRRIVESGLVKAWKRSSGRWSLCRESVEALRRKTETDPEFWDGK